MAEAPQALGRSRRWRSPTADDDDGTGSLRRLQDAELRAAASRAQSALLDLQAANQSTWDEDRVDREPEGAEPRDRDRGRHRRAKRRATEPRRPEAPKAEAAEGRSPPRRRREAASKERVPQATTTTTKQEQKKRARCAQDEDAQRRALAFAPARLRVTRNAQHLRACRVVAYSGGAQLWPRRRRERTAEQASS